MSKSKTQIFDFYQLGFQTSISCWQAAFARFSLFATRAPFDQNLIEEGLNMVSEKIALSVELGEILSSSNGPLENYHKSLETINKKAMANVNRLKDSNSNV